MTYVKKITIGIIIGMIIVVGGQLALSNKIKQFIPSEIIDNRQENAQQEVFLIIDDGQRSPQNFESKFREGMTAFDLLFEKTEEKSILLETKTYDIGVLIETIGDAKNGNSGKYWLYYVNGEMPQVAADKKEIKAGDKVEFKFEKSLF